MQETSDLYKLLLSEYQAGAPDVRFETRLTVSGQTEDSGIDYGEDMLITMESEPRMFSEDSPEPGNCVSTEIHVEMFKPAEAIPRQARLVPAVRLTDGVRSSEWIRKGVFYIDTRDEKEDGSSMKKLTIHGYDDMLKAEQDYPASGLIWPAADIDVVREIAAFIGVQVDARTLQLLSRGYLIEYPSGYTCRDVLGYIAAAYAGCFIMTDLGELRLVTIHGIPKETRYLIDSSGFAITFGGDRILV